MLDVSLQTLASIIKWLYNQSEIAKENKRECRRLAVHVEAFYEVIYEKCRDRRGVPRHLRSKIKRVCLALKDLQDTIVYLRKEPFLKRWLWSGDISSKIQASYVALNDAVRLFNFGAMIDLQLFQVENGKAREDDIRSLRHYFKAVLDHKRDLIDVLQVERRQFQEAMHILYNYTAKFPPRSIELHVCTKGLEEMQHLSGPIRRISHVPIITSLDVIVHRHKKLGAGGFGVVYEGTWHGKHVAIKELDRAVPEWMIVQELAAWHGLDHPNILKFYGASPMAQEPFFVCALMVGDIKNYLKEHPDTDRRKLLLHAARGLEYLHDRNVIHRDIKAANILIDKHGVACLSDFGLSQIKVQTKTIRQQSAKRIFGRSHRQGPNRPGPTEVLLGSARWMAPEQFDGRNAASKMADVYSFGMTIYEIYTGDIPFSNLHDSIVYAKVVERDHRPERPKAHAFSSPITLLIDDSTWKLINKAWRRNPQRRPTASDLVKELNHRIITKVTNGKQSAPGRSNLHYPNEGVVGSKTKYEATWPYHRDPPSFSHATPPAHNHSFTGFGVPGQTHSSSSRQRSNTISSTVTKLIGLTAATSIQWSKSSIEVDSSGRYSGRQSRRGESLKRFSN